LDWSNCLECAVDGHNLAIPVRVLDRALEYDLTAPPPLAEPWVGGLGSLGDDVWISLALPGRPRGPVQACRGLLLRSASGARFAIQVDEIGSLIRTAPGEGSLPRWPVPAGWLSPALAGLLLDVDAVAAWLFGEGPR